MCESKQKNRKQETEIEEIWEMRSSSYIYISSNRSPVLTTEEYDDVVVLPVFIRPLFAVLKS